MDKVVDTTHDLEYHFIDVACMFGTSPTRPLVDTSVVIKCGRTNRRVHSRVLILIGVWYSWLLIKIWLNTLLSVASPKGVKAHIRTRTSWLPNLCPISWVMLSRGYLYICWKVQGRGVSHIFRASLCGDTWTRVLPQFHYSVLGQMQRVAGRAGSSI